MFKKILKLINSKVIISSDIELADGEIIQIIEPGKDARVIITMEYLFLLQAKSEKDSTKRVPYDRDKIRAKI